MDLVRSGEIGAPEYERFLDRFARRPGTALAYHYPFYLRFLADVAYQGSTLRFVTARNGAGELTGVMPGLHVRTSRISVWLSLAYFGPNAGALVIDSESEDPSNTIRALAAAAREDARELGCGSMTVYTPLETDIASYREGLGVPEFEIPRTTQWMTIPADPDTSPWPRKVRYDIRRAASSGVTVRRIADEGELDVVWCIYHRNCEDGGVPVKPREHIRCLFQTARDRGLFLLAEHDGQIIAGFIGLMGGGVLSYYLPCTKAEARSLQPGLLLLDHAVSQAGAAGCRLLNFEASPGVESSVHAFKARCGGVTAPYHVLVKLLGPKVLDDYRTLTADGIAREVPHAFVVPFDALS